MKSSYLKYRLILSLVFLLICGLLAIDPHDRKDWALENVLVLLFGLGMWGLYKYFVFSRVSYTLIFLFLCLHSIGAHYTYAQVPYNEWWTALTGHDFNSLVGWQRNNFDRVVHFSYGLLLAYPIREVFLRVADVRGFWGYFLPLDFMLATSALYELFEWAAAELFAGDLGAAYLGSQGDVWDAQKDMAIAALGALIAMMITAAINAYLQRDFAKEWSDSLKVKDSRPLGEEEIGRLLRQRKI